MAVSTFRPFTLRVSIHPLITAPAPPSPRLGACTLCRMCVLYILSTTSAVQWGRTSPLLRWPRSRVLSTDEISCIIDYLAIMKIIMCLFLLFFLHCVRFDYINEQINIPDRCFVCNQFTPPVGARHTRVFRSSCIKLAFHDADTDTDTDILPRIVARMSAFRSACHRNNFGKSRVSDVSARMSVSVSASWNSSFTSVGVNWP